MKTNVTLVKGDAIENGLATDYRDALPVNMYAVQRDILGAQGYMYQWYGLTQFTTGAGKDRGANYNERFGIQYRVTGDRLYQINDDATTVDLGEITGSKQASMPYSFNTQGIVADGKFWLYSPGSGFNEVTDSSLGDPIDATWINGYYFFTDGDSLYHTDITDETSIDPLKFATAEFSPDPILGVGKTPDNKVVVFGRYTTEYFSDTASDNFAFTRLESRAQKIGIVATHAKVEVADKWYVIGGRKGDSLGIHIIAIGSTAKVSTREVDKLLKEYSEADLSDVRAESIEIDNSVFVMFHLPDEVLLFNETIAAKFGNDVAWSLLRSTVSGNTPFRGINGVYDAAASKWIFGDKINSTIGYLNDDVATHYDELAEWILYTPFMKLTSTSITEMDIETIPGHTATNDATVAVSFTSNGISYGTEYWAEYGEINDYEKRFVIRRIGYVRDWLGAKFRGASESRMAFGLLGVTYE